MAPTLVEVSDSPDGWVEMKVRDSNGARIAFLQIAEDDLDDELLADIKAWQARHSHRGLILLPASAG